jgi:hypothetical protein
MPDIAEKGCIEAGNSGTRGEMMTMTHPLTGGVFNRQLPLARYSLEERRDRTR